MRWLVDLAVSMMAIAARQTQDDGRRPTATGRSATVADRPGAEFRLIDASVGLRLVATILIWQPS